MIRDRKSARIYAMALIETIESDEDLSWWEECFQRIGEDYGRFTSTRLRAQEKPLVEDEAFRSFIDQAPPLIFRTLNNFLKVLASNRKLSLLPVIGSIFLDLAAARNGATLISLVTATAWSEQEKTEASMQLREVFPVLKIRWMQDPQLLAGVKICYGDWVIDLSARGALMRLQKQFGHP